MNTIITLDTPIASNIEPSTGHKTEFYSLSDFVQGCIDQHNFKVKPESYICSQYPDYDCAACYAIPLANPKKLSEITGYMIKGAAKKYDTDKTPHQLIDSKYVSFSIGTGEISANTNRTYIPYVLATDDSSLFSQLAKAGQAVVFHKDIDQAYQIINEGMDEAIFRAMTGFNDPKFNKDLFVKLHEGFKTFDVRQITQFFLDEIKNLKQIFDTNALIQERKEQWGELVPLQIESLVKTPYPIDDLPLLAKEAVIAISEYVQAPIGMTAQCVIGAMSHIAQAKVNAPNPFENQGEPCSLYLLTEGQSGSRKSSCLNMANKAIFEYERKQYELYRLELEQWQRGQVGLNKNDLRIYYAENPEPQDPSMLFSDITLESLSGLYIDGVLRNASISSDEASQFFGGYTMKADTRIQAAAAYVKIFDIGYVERIRAKSNLNGSGRAYDIRLSFNLQGQRAILADALKDPVLIGQGFLPRFLITVAENLAGTRLQTTEYRAKNANDDHRLKSYWSRCKSLLDECPRIVTEETKNNSRYVIPMNEEAIKIDETYYNLFESLQGMGKRYEYLQAFASRGSQLARRLATVFAYFEGLSCIDAKTLKGACEIVKHSLNEWATYADIEVKTESDAQRLIKWLIAKCVAQKTDRLTYSYVQTSCPRPMQKNKNLLKMIIQQLGDSNHIRIELLGRTQYIVINPILLESSLSD